MSAPARMRSLPFSASLLSLGRRFGSRSFRGLLGVAALGAALTGCVSSDKYAAMKLAHDQSRASLGEAENDAREQKALSDAYKSQRDSLINKDGTNGALVANVMTENATLRQQLEDMNKRYADVVTKVSSQDASPLPIALTNELTKLAAQNPEVVDFDAGRGTVKFKSDVTFPVGSDQLTDRAADVIGRFATILNSAGAASYELQVAGHTDSAPVHNPNTIKAGHKDNWYLSSHRAISVAKALSKAGVNPARLGVVGYADLRPIASNATEAGKAQNRRVEVLILPTTVNLSAPVTASASDAATPASAARPAAARGTPARAARPAFNKDNLNKDNPVGPGTAITPNAPLYGK